MFIPCRLGLTTPLFAPASWPVILGLFFDALGAAVILGPTFPLVGRVGPVIFRHSARARKALDQLEAKNEIRRGDSGFDAFVDYAGIPNEPDLRPDVITLQRPDLGEAPMKRLWIEWEMDDTIGIQGEGDVDYYKSRQRLRERVSRTYERAGMKWLLLGFTLQLSAAAVNGPLLG